jgi:hypothetical protein
MTGIVRAPIGNGTGERGRNSRLPNSRQTYMQARRCHVLRFILTVSILCLLLVSCSLRTARPSDFTTYTPVPTPSIPVSETDDVHNTETIESGLLSVRRFKVRFDAGIREPSGNLVQILRGTGQFESRGGRSEPLSYLWMHLEGESDSESSIEILLSSGMVSARGMGLGDRWIAMTLGSSARQGVPEKQGNSSLAMDDPTALLVAMAGMPGMRDVNLYPETGLPASGEDLDKGWEFVGEATLNGQTVYQYSYRSNEGGTLNRVMPSILQDAGIIAGFSTDLWVGALDGYPHRICHTLDLSLGFLLESTQIEINLYPYDFNVSLDLPSDLPS